MQTENNKATEKVESTVSEQTRQETETQSHQKWLWVEASLWTVRMLAALVNGVKVFMDGFELTIHGTGYPLPGGYDEFAHNLTNYKSFCREG